MHGLGNDFMIVDAVNQDVRLDANTIKRWSDRHSGVGFDQLLLVETADSPTADFRYRIYNADGKAAEHCGNGARCFAHFVRAQGLTDKTRITISTPNGMSTLQVQDDGQVQVDMGEPQFAPQKLPFICDAEQTHYELTVNDETLTIGAVSMGNPHAVLLVDDADNAAVHQQGGAIEAHARFPQRVNVGFMQVLNEHHFRLRVYERGVGETQACGSGACAAMAVGRQWGLLADKATAHLNGGDLSLEWQGPKKPGAHLLMTGPATHVYDGVLSV